MVTRATIKVRFESAHRLMYYIGKCKNIHGHNYVLEVEVIADELDDVGFVIDFGDLKRKVKSYIDDEFDHKLILSQNDIEYIELLSGKTDLKILHSIDDSVNTTNPTAENMARFIYEDLSSIISENNDAVDLYEIRLYENENSIVTYNCEC